MVCANCGSDNKTARQYCRECGVPLVRLCATCGVANDPTDRFCGGCGTALDDTRTADGNESSDGLHRDPHERRFVAVLFADLVGSTQYAEGRDPEIVRDALTGYFDLSRDVITRFGGTVEKYIGDAVMAVWGATVAREDDAERAVRAGLELIDVVAHAEGELKDLELRVGVLTGEASVSPTTPEQGLVVGDLVNTAARLQSIADPGTVVVGGATYRMLRSIVHFEPQGEYALKGKADTVAVWRAVRVMDDTKGYVGGGGWEPPFIGRREELRLLKDALRATERTSRSRLVSIVGEAGIGKSRLAGELRKYTDGLAEAVCWHDGRSPAYDQGLTFWALGEMVRQRAGIADTDDPMRSRTKLRTAVAEFVPSPADREWIEPRLAALIGLDSEPTGEQGEFFAAIRCFFQHIATRTTTLLVFEDFHWADSGLVEFVRDLVEMSPRHPILVVTLARPDLYERVPGWGAGRRDFASTHLGSLTNPEMSELVTGMVQGIGQDLLDTIVERASGIPLYAVELVRMLVADGALVMDEDSRCTPTRDLSDVRVPDTVRAVIEARLDRLPASTRSLLQDAAVLGAAFTSAGLGAMCGQPPNRIEALLEPLVHRELLELEQDPQSPELGQYRFVQGMIREIAYGRLTREERRVRHVRAAEFFAGLGELELAGAVACHLMDAHRVTSDADQAAILAREAAAALGAAIDRAARMHSHAQAIRLTEQALEITTDEATRANLSARAALSASSLARHEEAIEYARLALAVHREQDNSRNTAEAAALLGTVLCSSFRPVDAIEALEPIVKPDTVLAEPGLVRAGAQLARAYLMAIRDTDAAVMADRVAAAAESLGLAPTVLDAMITRGTALGNMGRMHEAIALLQGASRFAEDHELSLAQLRAYNNLGHLLAFDDHPGAMEACRSGMELADRLGEVGFLVSFAWAVAAYLDRDGRFVEAQRVRDDVRDRFELPHHDLLWYELADAMARVERGDAAAIPEAYDLAQRSLDDGNPQSRAAVPVTKARLDVIAGRFRIAYDEVMSVPGTHRFPEHYAIAVVAASMGGDGERLEVVLDNLASSPGRGRMLGSTSSTVTGVLAALSGDTEGAVAAFTRALSFRYLRLDKARLQGLYATVVGRDVPDARRAGDEAFELLSEFGANAYLGLYAEGMPAADGQIAAGS